MSKKNFSTADLLEIYTNATDIIQHGVVWIDKVGRIIGVNNQFAKDLGYDKETFGIQTIYQINPTTSIRFWHKHWEKLLKNRQVLLKTEHISSEGTIFPVEMRCVLVNVGGTNFCCGIVENLVKSNRYQNLLKITSELTNAGSWQLDLISGEWLITEELFDLLGVEQQNDLTTVQIIYMLKKQLSVDDFSYILKNVKRTTESGLAFETKISFHTPKNDALKIHLTVVPIMHEKQCLQLLGTLQPIAVAPIASEEMKLAKATMDNVREMVFWVTADASLFYMNRPAIETTGYSRKELTSMKINNLMPDITAQEWKNRWTNMKNAGRVKFESKLQNKEGLTIPASFSLSTLRFNKIDYELALVRDLRPKKAREEITRLFYNSLNQSADIIFWLNPDATFKYYNNTFCEKLNYTRAEIDKMTLLDFFPNHTDEAFKMGWKLLQQGEYLRSRMEIYGKNDILIPVETSVSLVRFEGKEYSCSILRDISEIKERETELLKQMEENEKLRKQLEIDNTILNKEIDLHNRFENIITTSKTYKKQVLKKVEQVAVTDATVLILGETGTGKELLARAIHKLSRRANRPLIKINCAVLPDNLIESELFGHEKGAFTGAYQKKVGRFELANNGTIFLDEIGELPLSLQAKLLRVLQEGEFERVGGNKTFKINVRIITATNRDIESEIKMGNFREDLFYRLNVFPVYNIPLRKRKEDIPLLIKHFVKKFTSGTNKEINEIPQAAINALMEYEFPGNVRELENIIERAVIITHGNRLQIDTSILKKKEKERGSHFKTLEEVQKAHIIQALKRTNWRVSGPMGAAKLLNINPKTLNSRMKKLGIKRKK